MMKLALLAVALLGCSKAAPTAGPHDRPEPGVAPMRGPEISVELSGVTLADDCPDGQPTKAVPPPVITASAGAAPAAKQAAGSLVAQDSARSAAVCAGPDCQMPPPSAAACEQTSMQLAVRSSEATQLVVKKVELLDNDGVVVGELVARGATRWDASQYVAWDEAIAANAPLSISYQLTAPDWNKIAKGRWKAMGMKFQLRVTVSVGTSERTIEKQSISPALPEPAVAT